MASAGRTNMSKKKEVVAEPAISPFEDSHNQLAETGLSKQIIIPKVNVGETVGKPFQLG